MRLCVKMICMSVLFMIACTCRDISFRDISVVNMGTEMGEGYIHKEERDKQKRKKARLKRD